MKRSVFIIVMVGFVSVACSETSNLDAGSAPTTHPTAAPSSTASSTASSTVGPVITTSTSASEDPPDSIASPGQKSGGLKVERGIPLGQIQKELVAGEVKLWVSNQSSTDDPVSLTISIDGIQVVDEQFDVEGQHNWIAFDITGLEPGRHELAAVSDTGVEHTETFTVLEGEPRWLVLDYWYDLDDPQGRHLTFGEFDRPVAFA